jgi:hypothetical protein
MNVDNIDELYQMLQAAHRRIDELKLQIVRLEGQVEGQSGAIKKLEDMPSRLAAIETTLQAIQQRLPQQAAPISPWAILMTVLGWGVSLVLAVVAWTR